MILFQAYAVAFLVTLAVNSTLDLFIARRPPNESTLLWSIIWPLFWVLLVYLYLNRDNLPIRQSPTGGA